MAQSGYLGWVGGGWWQGLARLFARRARGGAAAPGWRGIFGHEHEEAIVAPVIRAAPVAQPIAAATRPAFQAPPPVAIEARVKRLKRRAAIDMFDQVGLAPIPGQLWRFVDGEADPFNGVSAFLRALGLDPAAVRRRDSGEIARANAVLELLYTIDHVFDRVSPSVAAALEARLCSGDYKAVRGAAEVAQTFERIARLEARWPASHRLAVLSAFLDDVRGGLADPLGVPAHVVAHAQEVADELGRQMGALDTELRDGAALHQALLRRWPSIWDNGPQHAKRARAEAETADAHRQLLTNAGLRHVEVEAQIGRIRAANDVLSQLLGLLDGEAPTRAKSEAERALSFFGFPPFARPDLATLAARFRILARANHPDLAPADPEARAAAHQRFVELNAHYEVLKALV